MDDSQLHTGVDSEPEGIFGNEVQDEQTKQDIQEQNRQIQQLTPQIEKLLATIDAEIESVMSVERFITATTQPAADIRAELQASALYKKYLEGLKTKFTLDLNETKKKK